ncbi:MAG: NUDIX hydrolase [Candidatus Baltobacteraceae bacterium]
MNERRRWKVLGSEYAIETPHLRLRRDRIELPSGLRIDDYFVRESRGFAVVFAVCEDERVVMVRQYKHGIGGDVLELPAGAIDADESPLDCARRELAEETGFVAPRSDFEPLRVMVTDPTNSDGRAHLYLARGVRRLVEPNPDPTEEIAVEFASLADLRTWVADGTIEVAVHVAAVYIALERLGHLAVPNAGCGR